jgi:hypothetical protein
VAKTGHVEDDTFLWLEAPLGRDGLAVVVAAGDGAGVSQRASGIALQGAFNIACPPVRNLGRDGAASANAGREQPVPRLVARRAVRGVPIFEAGGCQDVLAAGRWYGGCEAADEA